MLVWMSTQTIGHACTKTSAAHQSPIGQLILQQRISHLAIGQ